MRPRGAGKETLSRARASEGSLTDACLPERSPRERKGDRECLTPLEHLKGRASRSSLLLFTPHSHLPPPSCPFPRSCPAAVLRLSMSSQPTNAHHSLSPVRPSRAVTPQTERIAPQPHLRASFRVPRRPTASRAKARNSPPWLLWPRTRNGGVNPPLPNAPGAGPAGTHSPPQEPSAPRPVTRLASVSPVTS